MIILKKLITAEDDQSLIDLKKFIVSNICGTQTFRYFDKRPYSIVKNHLYTCLYYLGEVCVGYGHLDFEDEKTWLGIIVADNQIGKNIGDQIMNDLISNSKHDIYLSVDINNNSAICLYQKKGFEIIENTINHYIMKLRK